MTEYYHCGNGEEKEVAKHYTSDGQLIKTVIRYIDCADQTTTTATFNNLGQVTGYSESY